MDEDQQNELQGHFVTIKNLQEQVRISIMYMVLLFFNKGILDENVLDSYLGGDIDSIENKMHSIYMNYIKE